MNPLPVSLDLEPFLLSDTSAAEVPAGRVTHFVADSDVTGLSILDRPEVGNLTVNPDNSLALVLTGSSHEGPLSFSVRATYADGTTDVISKSLTVTPLLQQQGWATGETLYMLETDEAGDLVIEHGENHRLVHVSRSQDALSLKDIAALEGLAADDIDGDWLAAHPEYGADPAMALDERAGRILWRELTGLKAEPSSHWLLFERGHDYEFSRLIEEGTQGESELHPIYVGAYGEGTAPRMLDDIRIFQAPSSNIVFQGIETAGEIGIIGGGSNVIFDSIVATSEMSVDQFRGLTIRDSAVYDVRHEEPVNGADEWDPNPNRLSGTFANKTHGVLVEGTLYDHNGWASDYDYNRSADYGQPPSMYSHNLYLQQNNTDVTVRDNIIMRGASFGAQVRSGGHIEDNVFIDNNAALNFLGGRDDTSTDIADDKTGHFTLLTDNLITSGAYKQVSKNEGARTRGIDAFSRESTLLDNIVAHLANPDDPVEQAESAQNGGGALRLDRTHVYDNTIVYNWIAGNEIRGGAGFRSPDANTEHLDTDIADQTTIQRFTADLLGVETATIDDLGRFLRDQMTNGALDPVEADEIIAYFQKAFGIAPDIRTEAATLRFVPDALADGVRWDNRLNWDTEDLPGQIDGDSVDLAGNWVTYAARTTTIEDLDLGSGGRLSVTSGRLTVDGELSVGEDGAEIDIDKAGQFWLDGYSDHDRLDIDLFGGRFANTGDFTGTVDFEVTGGQALLATSGSAMHLGAGSRLAAIGGDAFIGFDGVDDGIATLRISDGARLDLIADESGIAEIGEFRSGHYGQAISKVQSAIHLEGGTFGIDLSGYVGKAFDAVLLSADEILGRFDEIEVIGFGATQDVTLTFDYTEDMVNLDLTAPNRGTGLLNVNFTDAPEMDDDEDDQDDNDNDNENEDDDNHDNEEHNTGPVADAESFEVAEDGKLTVATTTLLDGDTDADGDALAVVSVSNPVNGTVSLDDKGDVDASNDEVIFTPTPVYSGVGSFIYTVSDSYGGTDTATVSVTVSARLNELPVVSTITAVFGEDDTGRKVDLLDPASVSDPDGDDLDVENVKVTTADGRVLSTMTDPETGLFFLDDRQFEDLAAGARFDVTIDYDVTDGLASVANRANMTIWGVNDAPEARDDGPFAAKEGVVTGPLDVLANDADFDGDDLTIVGGDAGTALGGRVIVAADGTSLSVDYTSVDLPGLTEGETRADSFEYVVSDGDEVDRATVTVTLTGKAEPEPEPELKPVIGTDASNPNLVGTDGANRIDGLGGAYDILTGLAGADVFDIAGIMDDGVRQVRRISDFDAAEGDLIDLGGAGAAMIREIRGSTYIHAGDDGDVLILQDVSGFDTDNLL